MVGGDDGRVVLSEVAVGLSAGFVLRARAVRDCARRCARAHRHGRVGLGVDSFHLSLVQPLGFRFGGRHLVQWHHLH